MKRPYKVKHATLVGVIAVVLSAGMLCMYVIPGSGSTLALQEWAFLLGWTALGVIFYFVCKKKYGDKFGSVNEIISDADALALQLSDEELGAAVDSAIDEAIKHVLDKEAVGSML